MQPAAPSPAPAVGIVVDDSACDVDDLSPCGGVHVTVPGEHVWDELVALAVESGWTGLELLSGVPGTVADVVRANVSAHGQEASDTVASVRTWDWTRDAQRTLAWADCRFGPGSSRLQEQHAEGGERYRVLEVSFLLKQGDFTAPVGDARLADLLGVAPGTRVPIADARRTALARAGSVTDG